MLGGAEDDAVMTLLREHPERTNERDRKGRTPLFLAARARRRELVLRMLAEGADPLVVAADGGTAPVHLAWMGKESAMVQDLVDAALCAGPHGTAPRRCHPVSLVALPQTVRAATLPVVRRAPCAACYAPPAARRAL